MKFATRIGLVAGALTALAVCFFADKSGLAGGINKKVAGNVQGVADALQKGDNAAAMALAKKVANNQEEIYEPMLLLGLRKKRGWGVGKVGAFDEKTDGIEKLIQDFVKAVPTPSPLKIKRNKDALMEMAYRTAAVAHISNALTPLKEKDRQFTAKKPKAKWVQYSKDMGDAAMEFAKAVSSGQPAAVKAAVGKLDNSCNSCHSVFRD